MFYEKVMSNLYRAKKNTVSNKLPSVDRFDG